MDLTKLQAEIEAAVERGYDSIAQHDALAAKLGLSRAELAERVDEVHARLFISSGESNRVTLRIISDVLGRDAR